MLREFKQTLVNFLGKIYLTNFLTKIIINLKLYYLLLPHDVDFFGISKYKNYISDKDILDIGGHLGLASLSIRYLGFNENFIHIFEPNKMNYKSIKKIRDNKMKLYKYGLSDRTIKMTNLIIPKKGLIYLTSASTLDINYLNNKKYKLHKQKTMLLKFDELNFKKKIGLIKVDVEGHELKVLIGMYKSIIKNLPILIVEFNNNYLEIFKIFKKKYNIKKYDVNKNKFANIKSTFGLRNYYLIPKKITTIK